MDPEQVLGARGTQPWAPKGVALEEESPDGLGRRASWGTGLEDALR